ncbi:MAG: hypothetical protein Q9219_006612 [cf. Caloplaca sp. 3 TL-2023]
MVWRLSRHQRLPQLRPTRSSCVRNFFTTPQDIPTIANAFALQTRNDLSSTSILVTGTVRTIRKQKRHAFLEVGDGSSVQNLQAVLSPEQAEGLSTGASVAVQGFWRPSPPGKEQSHELQAEKVTLIGAANAEKYPLQKKFQTPEFLRTFPHLRLRLPLHTLLTRMRSESDFLLAQFFRARGFLRLQPPIITSSDCEGAGETFSVASRSLPSDRISSNERLVPKEDLFFREPKYLTVSSQLHLEAYMSEHPKVWTFTPTFRAEKSDTPRHVSEFWMLEAELRTQSLEELMDLTEDMIKSLVHGYDQSSFLKELITARRFLEKSESQELTANSETLTSRWDYIRKGSWPRITYSEAMQLLQESFRLRESEFVHEPSWDVGLQLEHEKYVVEKVGQGKPVFVTHYPSTLKPFYMLPSEVIRSQDDVATGTAACFDLLLPELCEVVGGSLREHRLQELSVSMGDPGSGAAARGQETGIQSPKSQKSINNLDWYVDLRRFGSVPHGGFGFGFDRLLCYLAGIRNIKDVVPWPRYYGRCQFSIRVKVSNIESKPDES